MTDPYPNFSTKNGLSVEPPKSDTRKGQDEINIKKYPLKHLIPSSFFHNIQ